VKIAVFCKDLANFAVMLAAAHFYVRLQREMKKRLRKKKHIGDFTVFGVEAAIRLKDGTDFDEFLDNFVRDAIEENNCYFGGGGQGDKISGIIELGRKSDSPEIRLKKISNWIDINHNVERYAFGNINDLWYTDFEEFNAVDEKI
jgi:uncharacterized protein YggL (DUF469 family)